MSFSIPSRIAAVRPVFWLAVAAFLACCQWAQADSRAGAAEFRGKVRPILQTYCFDCHADGARKGNVAFDEFKSDSALLENKDLWWKALKNVRAGMMPPAKKPRPTAEEQRLLTKWIKGAVFCADPANPDPGRVTVRRLNRVEYRNTIRDLTGVDYDTQTQFPPDDTGYGFDTIADVLTLPSMLLEKYMIAAENIVAQAVPEKQEGAKLEVYRRFFPRAIPAAAKEREAYAREILGSFARKAYRRPVDEKTVKRLTALAVEFYSQPGQTFEMGIGRAMVAVLSSPRFLFREEAGETKGETRGIALVDEYALASRLSYFLWSSMPDEELMREASEGRLRQDLPAQMARMLKDSRAKELTRNFTGQWLRARDIDNVQIDDDAVLERERGAEPEMEKARHRFYDLENKGEERLSKEQKDEKEKIRSTFFQKFGRPLMTDLSPELRADMRHETEDVFNFVVQEDRSLLELIDSDYTFLDERLAHFYGITNVTGREMRRVQLPPDSPRGGVMTEATVLVVTSNPTRTSPVKRGLFILDCILGTPPPPPPANIPPLEDAAKGLTNHTPSLRETLAAHRASPLCASCHNRMDPLGLALENFNALGMWRQQELHQPIEASGTLLTGESFANFTEIKHILARKHSEDFYRTLTEKMLTYALGRGLDYYDVETVDQIVNRIEQANGRASALLYGIVESAPFQKTRGPNSRIAKN